MILISVKGRRARRRKREGEIWRVHNVTVFVSWQKIKRQADHQNLLFLLLFLFFSDRYNDHRSYRQHTHLTPILLGDVSIIHHTRLATQGYVYRKKTQSPISLGSGAFQGGRQRQSNNSCQVGHFNGNNTASAHIQELDKPLPGTRTQARYDHPTRPKATISAQMIIGKRGLKSYLHVIGADESGRCECGQKETVKHVSLDCKLWRAERNELRNSLGDRNRWGDVPFLLGG